MKAPEVPTYDGVRSEVPLGFWIETNMLQQLDVPIVTPVILSAIRRPSVPANVTFRFSFADTVIVTGGPPGSITTVRSALPETERLSVRTPAVADTVNVSGPASAGVYVPV